MPVSGPRTIPRLFLEHADARSDSAALIDAGSETSLSYGQLRQAAAGIAEALAGDRGRTVAMRGELGSPLVAGLLGAWLSGVAVAVVDPQAQPATAAHTALGDVRDIDPAALLPASSEPPCIASPDDVAVVMATSGTSGRPKYVPLSHRALTASFDALNRIRNLSTEDVYLSALPPSHIAGINLAIAHSLAAGTRLVLQRKFDADGFLQLVERHGVTVVNLVPTMLHRLIAAQRRGGYDLGTLRHVSCGASAFSVADAHEFEDVCGVRVYAGYGLTETSSITHHSQVGDVYRSGVVGPPLPGTEHRIVDLASGAELPAGATGEIWLRGPQLADQYLNAPAETAASFPGGGWFRSGDLGSTTERGELVVTGRYKDIIKYKGHQVSAVEIEQVIETHPLVLEGAAAGVPDSDVGELPVAFVVPATHDLSAEEILDWVRSQMHPHSAPRRVVLVSELPRTTSGKVRRYELVSKYLAEHPDAEASQL